MKPKVRKVIIPAAGLGTRFAPFTKSVPKEMLPIIDTPVIHKLVEEAFMSGIEEVIIVTTESKDIIKRHFEAFPDINKHITFIHQNGPYGSATPVLNAASHIGDEPFALFYGDEVFVGEPRLAQLMRAYDRYEAPVFALIPVDDEGTKRYGIVESSATEMPGTVRIKSFVEKPGPEAAPSRLASIGAYIMTPDVFEHAKHVVSDVRGEYSFSSAFAPLLERRPLYGVILKGTYFDTGTKLGWLQANMAFGLEHPEFSKDLKDYLSHLL
ncbi:hypothetical protein A2110_02135 [Candidatus Jorgensenbacteria bacterium GWA1_54_12]|uniref:UTP--glucose-1-phosphate uridylyltransferase n=1 Tax=Candidatus Jorgensenbacteria bacterium GWA1_54_12 TaxID=1798468 RepID=A0A1F6BLE1_9BACT|nr:MAG: hypothetical protein A2110_02135 [Candidatus Jorgensenbacteria bacterium GWA1_54_12]